MAAAGKPDGTWLLLIYTVPAEPSRLRAAVWRDLKRAGAVYLRDGVAVLPERSEPRTALEAIAAKVEAFGGRATLARQARIGPDAARALEDEMRAARTAEFREVAADAGRLLEHVRRERAHRDFSFAELEELEADLEKLRRWAQQIRARDYFGAAAGAEVDALLQRCEAALASFLEEAARADETARRAGGGA